MVRRIAASFFIALALVAVILSATRAPDAVLRTAFAHACAAANHADMELFDRGEAQARDPQARADVEAPKLSAAPRATGWSDADAHAIEGTRAASSVLAFSVRARGALALSYRAEPPSRVRARLMVFLN